MRIENAELLRHFKEKTRCEFCGRSCPQGCDPAHIFSRGAGRLDVAINLISLCRGFGEHGWVSCHQDHHAGKITNHDLLAVVSRREKCLQDSIVQAIFFFRALPKDVSPTTFAMHMRHWEFSMEGARLAKRIWEELCNSEAA